MLGGLDVEEPEELRAALPRASPPGTSNISYFSVFALLRGCAVHRAPGRLGAGWRGVLWILAGGLRCWTGRGGGAADPNVTRSRPSLGPTTRLLRSRVHDALENAPRAVKWYRAALVADPFNYDVRC